jgi:competence protein ComGC
MALKPSKQLITNTKQAIHRQIDQDQTFRHLIGYSIAFTVVTILLLVFLPPMFAKAQNYSPESLANAIYKAENSTSHPYGILKHYRHTTARQACLNTIKNSYKRWVKAGKPGDFVVWLGNTYCPPVNATNDPQGLNRNWVRNVHYFLNKGGKQ